MHSRPAALVRAVFVVSTLLLAPLPAPAAPPKTAPAMGFAPAKAAAPTRKAAPAAARKAAPATTVLARRSAGTPIVGWTQLRSPEWPQAGTARIARSKGRSVDVLRDPGGQTGALRFDPAETSAKDRAFLAISEQGGYVKVLLPIRPNGTVGWIRSSDVVLEPAAFRVVIDLQAHALTVEENGKVLLRQQVATGTGSNPTPQGLFYIVDRLPQANPGGGLGPFAFKQIGRAHV